MAGHIPDPGQAMSGVEQRALDALELAKAMDQLLSWCNGVQAVGEGTMVANQLQWVAHMEKAGAEAVGKTLDRSPKKIRELAHELRLQAIAYHSNLTHFYIEPMREAAKNTTKTVTGGLQVE